MKQRILHVLIALDQLAYVLLTLGAGHPDETLSAAAWRTEQSGKLGGVRFKRIVLGDKWTLDPVSNPEQAAQWARDNEGRLYDWQLILGFLAWAVPHKRSRVICSEACAEMLGLEDAWRFDPCVLRAAVGAKP